jgi:hypothetical protein
LQHIEGVAVDREPGEGFIYVTSSCSKSLVVLDKATLRYVKSVGTADLRCGGREPFRFPLGVAVDASRVYVSDPEVGRVTAFDRGSHEFAWCRILAAGQRPCYLAAGDERDPFLFVSDRSLSGLHVLSTSSSPGAGGAPPRGRYMAAGGGRMSFLTVPCLQGLALDPEDRIPRLYACDASGGFKLKFMLKVEIESQVVMWYLCWSEGARGVFVGLCFCT